MVQRIRQLLEAARLPGLAAVYLYGSHAAGRAHSESDVDIALLLDRETLPTVADRFGLRLSAIAALGDRLGAPTDIVVLNDLPPLFAREIVLRGVPVAIYDDTLDHAFRRDVQLRAADIEPFIESHRRRLLEALAG